MTTVLAWAGPVVAFVAAFWVSWHMRQRSRARKLHGSENSDWLMVCWKCAMTGGKHETWCTDGIAIPRLKRKPTFWGKISGGRPGRR